MVRQSTRDIRRPWGAGGSRRRIFHWPLFGVLGVVHIVVLPLVLSEQSDDLVAILAGLAYLALAVLDWRHETQPRHGSARR